jgi:hypothetical protein
MSGAEKREKMAVMEAAISSSLAHPNIVAVRALALPVARVVRGVGWMPGCEGSSGGGACQGR